MSSVRSLGLHESPAIPFLVAENLLPPEPSDDLYSWTTSVGIGPSGPVEDELLWTKSCVVWSRAGVIKRVFRLDLEKEDIKHALLTNFWVNKIKRTSDKPSSTTASKTSSPSSKVPETSASGNDEAKSRARGAVNDAPRALVVVLKSQAHIFFLEGNSHVVPLPFEVDSVFATPRGLLFQRKVAEEINAGIQPMAPPNSFISFSKDLRASQSLDYSSGKTNRPSLGTVPAQSPGWKSRANKRADLPRVFSLMDPHSEMGLVVTNQASRWLQTSLSSRPSGFDVLDPADEIIYVSPRDELSGAYRANPKCPLTLVLTVNVTTGLYTLWTARYREDETAPSSKKKRRRETGGTRSKRRSSHFGMTTGTTTPGARPAVPRESFGPRAENWNASVMSHSQYSTEGKPDDDDDFASQLGQDFGDIGVPSKTSRRVSSMLARTDLATSQDRITFSDLATGSQSTAPHSGGLRQSIGAGSTRGSFGFNPRSSLPPGAASVYSAASSFVDAPVDKLLEELNNDTLFEGMESMDLKESASGLPEEVLLTKVESFSSRFSGNFLAPSKLKPSKKLKVVTFCPTDYASSQVGESTSMALYVVDQEAKSMTLVNIRADSVKVPARDRVFSKRAKQKPTTDERTLLVQASGIQHFSGIMDVCKLVDGGLSRIVTLSATDAGNRIIHLQSLWNEPLAIGLPENLMLHENNALSSIMNVNLPREGGMKRVVADSSIIMTGLDHAAVDGRFDVVDSAKRRHKLQLRLEPTNALVRKAFSTCRFALCGYFPDKVADGFLMGWWETMQWLSERESAENDLEWTALVISLFAQAIPFIESDATGGTARQSRRKRGLLRSSSGSYVDRENWESMLDRESGSAGVAAPWMNTASWSWIVEQDAEDEKTSQERKSVKADQPSSSLTTCRKNTYLTRCAALTREFLKSPWGIAAVGAEGHLRKALANIEHSTHTPLCTILVALHLLREEQKLAASDEEQSHRALGLLAPVLAQLGGWLGWPSWGWKEGSYYGMEIASISRWQFEDTHMTGPKVPTEPLAPPSIFAFLDEAWSGKTCSFWTLLNLINSDTSSKRGRMWQWCYSLTPKTLSLNGFVSEIHSKPDAYDRIELLHRWRLTPGIIENLPEGVSAPLYEAILDSQTEASTSWSPSLLALVDRDDLSISMNLMNTSRPPPPSLPALSHDAMRDYHHIGNSTLDVDAINSFEASAEADRFSITRLIFRDDKRFIEAARLLNQSKAPVAECAPEPEWTDSDLLEAQKELVQLVTLRTLSIPTGRAMLAFSGRLPLLTEKLPIPSFSLQCVMKPSNVTISADRASFSEEKVCWAFFHNGVSTGLAISRNSKGIDTSWILFNKPQELTNRHAGFLLALGLNGHLRSLAKWVAFKYLTPKHTMTSIGLLLGLSASYLGTMDTLITRLLSVHVTRMLPLGAAELNLSPLTQTAGIMGIGLLYCNSQHRRMSEVMLSEIENADMEGSTAHEGLRDEGYRLAAGFSLGFINLGKGKDLKGMRDMHIVERLLAVAVGTKNVDIAHVLDRATAGATIALAIIFMKTNDEALAEKVDIPDTTVRFDYVRPDLFLLRTLARHIIMWDRIQPCDAWFIESLPDVYRRRYKLIGVRRLKSNDMPFFNIIAGLCFALGLRFSGSANTQVRDILLSYLDQFIRISRLPATTYDSKLARNSVRHCQDVVALSLAAVMAGTGDLALFRRLRSLHGRVDSDTPYGSHMAAHMAIGLLFLGGGSYTLGTSNLAVASLVCSLYPIFPTTVLDNKCHLQAFRHLWVLAAEPRCLVPRDLDSRRPVSIPITVRTLDGPHNTLNAPCLLPDLSTVARVEVRSPDYWPLVLDFAANPELREKFQHGGQSIYLRRKADYNRTNTSFFCSTLAGLSSAQDILPSSSALASNQGKGLPPSALPDVSALLAHEPHRFTPRPATQSIWDWIFHLPSLQGLLDAREKELVLPSSFPTRPRPSPTPNDVPWLRQSAADSKLLTESTVQNVLRATTQGRGANPDEIRDRLWQLKLLFSWIDARKIPSEEAGDNLYDWGFSPDGGLWLKRGYVEELRWKIWGVRSVSGE